MNNNTTHRARSKSASHNGRSDNDTNQIKEFTAKLYLSQLCWTRVSIRAASLAEAAEKANAISIDDIDFWEDFDGKVWADDVSPLGQPSQEQETKSKVNPLKKFRIIGNTEQLRQAVAEGLTDFRLLLLGGGYSRKTITATSKGRFHVVNHIDASSQVLTEKELFTESNIGLAMARGAFIAEGQDHD